MSNCPTSLRSLTVRIAACAFAILFQGIAGATGLSVEHGSVIRNWDTEEGLPASHVTALAQTPDGYLWIGTVGGLVRYDGVRFKTYYSGNTRGLPQGSISCLLTDRSGALWIGTRNGALVKKAGNIFQEVSLGAGAPQSSIGALAQDASGRLWGTFDRAGAFSYHDGQTTFYGTNSGLPSAMVWGVTVDGQNNIWMVSRWRLMRFDGTRWVDAEGLPPEFPRVSSITPSRDGGSWIACIGKTTQSTGDRGTRIFSYREGRAVEDPFVLPWSQDSRRSMPRVLAEDRQGRLWCATRGAGIFFRDDKRWQLFSEAPALSQSQAACILEDDDATLWFGMDGAGLYQLRPGAVEVLQPPSGMPTSCFWTVYPARDGAIWGGTDGNGIFRWKDGAVGHFNSSQGLTNEHVNAIIEDRESNIWAGTMGGLFVFKGKQFEPVGGPAALRLPVYALKEDRAGRIWAGTRNGLIRISAAGMTEFGEEQGIPYGPINAIEEDPDGRIWVSIPPFRDGTTPGPVGPYGLFAQTGKRFEHIAAGGWAGERHVRSLHADAAGNLWIGTISSGFYRWLDGGLAEYSRDDGIPHDRIQAIASDVSGNLWFCSELGVFGCPGNQLIGHVRGGNSRLNWWRIQRTDGLPNKSATGNGQPSAARGVDGRIWFANGNAVAGFDPAFVTRTARLRPPLIEEVRVDGVPQPLNDGRFRVTAATRRIEIQYTSPNTTMPALPTFWVRLKDFDPDWVNGGTTRVASYNLRPGKYEFAVAVTGPDGSRQETTSPLEIEVVPRFWERTSVRVLAGLFFVGGIALAVWRWEKARSQRRFRQLEIQRAMDQVRQRIARDIHDDLGSGLTEITLLSDNLRMDSHDPQAGRKTIERIAARARALTHEMDEVVWAINPRTDTLESLVTYLNDFAQERLALAGIRCRLNTPAELPNLELSADIRHSLYRAAKEALNNAIKHARPTEVALTIEQQAGNLVFIIEDNGRGFDSGQFKRGNGLKIMHERLTEIGGSFEVRSRVGSGTSIRFTVPAGRHHALRPVKHGNGHSQP